MDVRDRAKLQPAGAQGPDPERELLARAVQGDEAAVRDLFRRHVEKLYRHAARILGADDADVEDVVQQAFLAALAGGANFDGRSSVATWLFGITTRRALDAARSRWRRQRWTRVAEGLGLSPQAAPAPDRGMELRSEAEAMLAGLVPDQRLVFLLHDVEGYTFAEISAVTGIGISSLHARLASARKKLDRLAAERGQRAERGEDD